MILMPTENIVEQPTSRLERLTMRSLANVIPMRSRAYRDPMLERPEFADLICRHYAWRNESGQIAAALRIGYDQFEAHFGVDTIPEWLLNHRERVMVASRFFITPSAEQSGTAIAKEFFRAIWSAELERGTRLCVCLVRQELIPFYLRLGFYYVVDSAHLDARHRPTCMMACPANEAYDTPYQSVFADVHEPCCMDDRIACRELLKRYKTVKEQLHSELTRKVVSHG